MRRNGLGWAGDGHGLSESVGILKPSGEATAGLSAEALAPGSQMVSGPVLLPQPAVLLLTPAFCCVLATRHRVSAFGKLDMSAAAQGFSVHCLTNPESFSQISLVCKSPRYNKDCKAASHSPPTPWRRPEALPENPPCFSGPNTKTQH